MPSAGLTLLDVFGVLAPPSGAHGVGAGVFGFLTTRDARSLRLVSRQCCADVAAARWLDAKTRIDGSLGAWRTCFPGARAASVVNRGNLTDADFVHLAGVTTLNMWMCTGITDAGLVHLRGIHTLDMSSCRGITDAGLVHLRGIHTLNMRSCTGITDAGLAHLRGIHALGMRGCDEITDAGLAHLHGIHTLDMGYCKRVTHAGLAHLAGIQNLHMMGCSPATIGAALKRELPVKY
jgi:hypothetical protein